MLLGFLLIQMGLYHHITLTVDGISSSQDTRALLVSQVLNESGLAFSSTDEVFPSALSPAFLTSSVRVRRVRPVKITGQNKTTLAEFVSAERFPANLLLLAGTTRLFPGDLLTMNGRTLDPRMPLPPDNRYVLTYIPGVRITLIENNRPHVFYSARPTLAEALAEAGYTLSSADVLSAPPATPVTAPMTVTLLRAAPLSIVLDNKTIQVQSTGETVGQALSSAGMSLQGNDYTIPPEDQPIPSNRSIQVVRVREEIVLEQKTIPFETETVSSAEVDIDQRQVLQPGQNGLQVSRVRVRFENGKEVRRSTESEWTVTLPVKQQVAVVTRIPLQKLDTPSGTIEYYRSMSVYATSYSPCNSDANRCYNSTANGMRVQRGVIGVTRAWYNLLAGQRVYIPGYGIAVIADIGAGIPGKQWIDLGFSDSDYESWHQNVTLYFLTPIPPNVQWNLP